MTLRLADKPDVPPCGIASPQAKLKPNTKTRATRQAKTRTQTQTQTQTQTHTQSQAKRQKNRADLYDSVTDSIISQLEAGRVPWVQPWGRPETASPLGMPSNADTGRQYTGINILLLWAAAIDTARTTQTWLTYKQAQKLGAQVRKGESGTTVCYADTFIPKNEKLRAICPSSYNLSQISARAKRDFAHRVV